MMKQTLMNEKLNEILELSRKDSQYLTQSDEDSICYAIENLRKKINEIYESKKSLCQKFQ